MTGGAPSLAEVLDLLARLHRRKDQAYGNAWRKRGEVIGIFANIARKYDRLLVAMGENDVSGFEGIGDTVADLCVYAGKYATWLAEMLPDAFVAAGLGTEASQCAASRGPQALDAVFAALPIWERSSATSPPADVVVAQQRIRESFERLESGLMAQAEGRMGPPASERVILAFALTDASAWFLVRLAEDQPSTLERLRADIEAMEAVGR